MDGFENIPALGDTEGLEQYLNGSTLNAMGLGNQEPPLALQQNAGNQTNTVTAPATGATTESQTQQTVGNGTQTAPTFTAEQVAQIIRSQQAQTAQQPSQNQQVQQFQNTQPTYTPTQANIIKQLIDRGVSLDRIMMAMNQGRQNQTDPALIQKIQSIEQYLQNQQYQSEQNAFIDKMTTFGNKYGLTEDDLVTFGNKALSMGINVLNVTDLDTVFRAIYPEQYAIRSQRMSGNQTSQIYGGASNAEPTRAAASKMEDAYVDAFLKRSMPNQYGIHTK